MTPPKNMNSPGSVMGNPKPTAPNSQPADLDPLIHETARLQIVAVLNECGSADFNFLLRAGALSRGNLSGHMSKLVAAGYVNERKEFIGKLPHTEYEITEPGRSAYQKYIQDWTRLTGQGRK